MLKAGHGGVIILPDDHELTMKQSVSMILAWIETDLYEWVASWRCIDFWRVDFYFDFDEIKPLIFDNWNVMSLLLDR